MNKTKQEELKMRLVKKKNVINLIRDIRTKSADSIFMTIVSTFFVCANILNVIFIKLTFLEYLCALIYVGLIFVSLVYDIKIKKMIDLFYYLQSDYYQGKSEKCSFNIINSQNGHEMFRIGREICEKSTKKILFYNWIFVGFAALLLFFQIIFKLNLFCV